MPVIRPYTTDDTQAVMDLWYDTTVHDQSFIPRETWDQARPIVEHTYLPACRTWVAVGNSGAIIGFASLLGETLAGLYVARRMQSAGVGRALVDFVADMQDPLFVEVYEKNERARSFYRRCGFMQTHRFLEEHTGEMVIRKRLARH